MKKKIKSKAIKKTVPLTKSLGELMKDEDGFVSKETILKVGLSTVAALGIAGALTDISSGQSTTHTNAITTNNPQLIVPPTPISRRIHHINYIVSLLSSMGGLGGREKLMGLRSCVVVIGFLFYCSCQCRRQLGPGPAGR